MKKLRLFLIIGIALLFSCTNNSTNEALSNEEKLKITSEVDSLLKIVTSAYSARDMNSAFRFYDQSENFRYVGLNASMFDLNTLKSITSETYEKQFSEYKMDIVKREIVVYDNDLANSIITYNLDFTLTTNEKFRYENVIASILWRKINNEWRVIFQSESGLPAKISGQEMTLLN